MGLRAWALRLKREVALLWIAAGDARVPLAAKLVAAAVAAYALSPIDLIPDFIPVLGLLDDLLIVPVGIWLALRMIPPPLLGELRIAAENRVLPRSRMGAVLIIAIWLAAALLMWLWLS